MADGLIFRAGDIVYHAPTGEEWVVAYVSGDRLAWCGWPEGEAALSDCTLVKACTDDEHLRILRDMARAGGTRARRAQEALRATLATKP